MNKFSKKKQENIISLYLEFNRSFNNKDFFWSIFGNNGYFRCALIFGILGIFVDLFRTSGFQIEKPFPFIFMCLFLILSFIKYKYSEKKYNEDFDIFLKKNKITKNDLKNAFEIDDCV